MKIKTHFVHILKYQKWPLWFRVQFNLNKCKGHDPNFEKCPKFTLSTPSLGFDM